MKKLLSIAALLFAMAAPAAAQYAPPSPAPVSVMSGQVSLSVSNISSRVALPSTATSAIALTIYNTGTNDAYIALGDVTIAATSGGTCIASIAGPSCRVVAGTSITIYKGTATYLAGITASSTTTLVIYQGTGGMQLSRGGSGGSAAPTGPAGGVLGGTYPNPTFASTTGSGATVLATSPALTTPTATNLGVTGTAGGGYVEFAGQASAPATPAANTFRLYADSTGKLSWIGSNGYTRTFDGSTLTANHTWTLPDADGTFGLLGSDQTWTGANTFSNASPITLTSTATNGLTLYNTADQTTNYERLRAYWTGNVATIAAQQGGTGTLRDLQFIGGPNSFSVRIGNMAATGGLQVSGSTSSSSAIISQFFGNLSASSGTQTGMVIAPTINQSSTAGFTGLSIAPTLTGLGSGTNLLANFTGGHANLTCQLRLGYDSSNNACFLVSSGGNLSLVLSGTQVNLTGSLVSTGNLIAGASQLLSWNGRSRMSSPSDGTVLLTNNASTAFGRLIFGTNDTSGIAIAKSGTTAQFVLGDGTGAVGVQAGTLALGGATLGSDALAVTGNATFSGTVTSLFKSSSIQANSNLFVGSATGVDSTSSSNLQLGGSSVVGFRAGMRGNSATVLGVGYSYGGLIIGDQGITEAASGTHPLLANLAIKAPAFTNGAGATAIAATTYIEGAPTGVTGTTGNYALYSAAGLNYFGGEIQIGNTVNVVSPTSPNRTVTMVINGTTYYLAAKTTND